MKFTFNSIRKLTIPVLAGSIALMISACDSDSDSNTASNNLGSNDIASEITSPDYDSTEETIEHPENTFERAPVPDVLNAGVRINPVNRTRNDSVPRNFCIGSYSSSGLAGNDGKNPVTVRVQAGGIVGSWERNRGARFPLRYVKGSEFVFTLEGSNPLVANADNAYAATLHWAINHESAQAREFRRVLSVTGGNPSRAQMALIAYGSKTYPHYGLFNVRDGADKPIGSLVYVHPTENYLYYLTFIQYQFRSTSSGAYLEQGKMRGYYNTQSVRGEKIEFHEYKGGEDSFSVQMGRPPYSLNHEKALEARWIPILVNRQEVMGEISTDWGNGTYELENVEKP